MPRGFPLFHCVHVSAKHFVESRAESLKAQSCGRTHGSEFEQIKAPLPRLVLADVGLRNIECFCHILLPKSRLHADRAQKRKKNLLVSTIGANAWAISLHEIEE